MSGNLHLVKLCVGADRVEDLIQGLHRRQGGDKNTPYRHVTRMWPKRAEALLQGGSLYWVFKGLILARQRILRLEEVYLDDEIRRCGIVLEGKVIRTMSSPKRPFQGWRYLNSEDAPKDLGIHADQEAEIPIQLTRALSEIGVR